MRLVTNKLQLFPCKVPTRFIEEWGDYLIILVQHGTFVNHGYLFKIQLTVAWINGVCSKPNLNWSWYSILYFIKIDECGIEQ